MAEHKKPDIASLVNEKIFKYIILPITGFLAILMIVTVFFNILILKKQMSDKIQAISTVVNEFWFISEKILNVYALKTTPFVSSSVTSEEEAFMLSQYFHDIVFLDRNSLVAVRSIPFRGNLLYKTATSLPFQKTHKSAPDKFIPPYYSETAGSVVIGILNYNNPDYLLLGEVNLHRLWNFVNLSVRLGEKSFITDSYGNYVAHPDLEKVQRQENISNYGWFREITGDSIFRIGYYEESLFIIIGKRNIAGFWIFVLTPIWIGLTPSFYLISPGVLGGLAFLIGLRVMTKKWLESLIVAPFELFSSYVKGRNIDKDTLPGAVGFFSFKEGEILEQSFEKAISELRQKNIELSESEEKFRLISEIAPVGICLFQDDRLVYVNKEFIRMTGYTEEELLSITPFWHLVADEYQDIVAYNAKRRQQGILQDQLSYEVPIKTKDGSEKIIRATVSSMTFKSKPAGIVTMVDITNVKKAEEERKKLEAHLQKVQRLESMGTLVAGISHEFNNILHAIALNIEYIKTKLKDIEDRSLIERLEDIGLFQERAAMVVKSLLNFSRADGTEKKLFSLHEEIERVVRLCRQVFPKSIEIRTKFNETDIFVFAGEGQLEQIFLNLLNNSKDAIEETGRPGTIEIITEPFTEEFISNHTAPSLKTEYYVKVTIRDNGIGIPQSVIDKIFDPFFTTKPIGKGTGLGLSMVYGIVKQLEGSVTCESKWGEGTTFTLIFPAFRTKHSEKLTGSNEAPKEELSAEAERHFEKVKVLIVEDETAIRDMMAQYLLTEGYSVDTASDPEEALSLLTSSSYDLIITDLGLPGIGGEELLRELAIRKIGAPVIVASGYIYGSVLENLKRYGVVAFLTKPFGVAKLKEAIIKALSYRKA